MLRALYFILGALLGVVVLHVSQVGLRWHVYSQPLDGPMDLQVTLRNIGYRPASNVRRVLERTTAFPTRHSALILMDILNEDFPGADPQVIAEQDGIVRQRIAPLVAAARKRGMPIVHAVHRPTDNSGNVEAGLVVDWRGPNEAARDRLPQGIEISPGEWPPTMFQYRVGSYGRYSRHSLPLHLPYPRATQIHPAVAPRPTRREFVGATEEEVVRHLESEGIVHLFYVGFATDQCVLLREDGIVRMSARGYTTLLVRDATLANETGESLAERSLTKAAVLLVEANYGFSTTSDDLLHALNSEASALR